MKCVSIAFTDLLSHPMVVYLRGVSKEMTHLSVTNQNNRYDILGPLLGRSAALSVVCFLSSRRWYRDCIGDAFHI